MYLLELFFAVVLIVLALNFFWPILWILFIWYIIYYAYSFYQARKIQKRHEQMRQDYYQQTRSQAGYRNSSQQGSDVIDADFTVKDEE